MLEIPVLLRYRVFNAGGHPVHAFGGGFYGSVLSRALRRSLDQSFDLKPGISSSRSDGAVVGGDIDIWKRLSVDGRYIYGMSKIYNTTASTSALAGRYRWPSGTDYSGRSRLASAQPTASRTSVRAALEQLVDLRRVLAAGLGEVRPAAAAAADDRRQLLHELAGLHAIGQVFRDRHQQVHLAVLFGRQHDDAALDAIAQRVREAAQRVLLEARRRAARPASHRRSRSRRRRRRCPSRRRRARASSSAGRSRARGAWPPPAASRWPRPPASSGAPRAAERALEGRGLRA